MPSLDDIAGNTGNQLASLLQSAVETLSSSQQITFRLYIKQVLPLDGFVRWVNAAIINRDVLKRLNINTPFTMTLNGSLHRQVFAEQADTTSRTVNSLIFTPTEQIDDFNVQTSDALWLGEFAGTQFAFAPVDSRYSQAGGVHYRGTAILPTMCRQIINDADDISDELVLSNSMPIWLSLNQFAPVYPSFHNLNDLEPPCIVADVSETQPLQTAPYVPGRWQHAQDRVRITLYGLNNSVALEYLDYVVHAALEDEHFGITNLPVITDSTSNQAENTVLAKRKCIDFDANYYQSAARDISRQLIKQVIFNYEVK
ncbi:hypothetical protein N5923_21780 [Erwiniaceae bacterium BAC15a-03b]|uniref:Uncharacterized protein n=1 Tax=Winslowiella arboricola TaxID=2978220 RepID=A0A9J6PTW2_9GAMM|nr:hypothetical protein [Winslowiella arboricola]MCU5774722.1 hypothetical protein [Winslowiella arboricola]MCU5780126.1 hypothetical protein [Winslowiella arboricola]